jgi:hypothetical protein
MASSPGGSTSDFLPLGRADRLRLRFRRSNAGFIPRERFGERNREWLRWVRPRAALISLTLLSVIVAGGLIIGSVGGMFLCGFGCGASSAFYLAAVELAVPMRIENWRIGAAAERRTARVLRRFEERGWIVHHSVPVGRSDRDHIVMGPNGIFLLDTKSRAGHISIEDGALVVKYRFTGDDPPSRNPVAPACKARAAELANRVLEMTNYRPWVKTAVVIWGDFPAGKTVSDRVTFIHGDRLAAWLEEEPRIRVPEWLFHPVVDALGQIADTTAGRTEIS